MKKLTILFLSVITLSGCSFFKQEREVINQESVATIESTVDSSESVEYTNGEPVNTSSESI